MSTYGRRSRGFTLIELVIVVVVLAVIAMMAIPSYGAAINKAHRAEGKILLQTLMAAEERYYINFNRYTSDMGPKGLAILLESQPGRYYALSSIDVSSDAQFVMATAVPQNAQRGDGCGDLTLDSTGRRGAQGGTTTECW